MCICVLSTVWNPKLNCQMVAWEGKDKAEERHYRPSILLSLSRTFIYWCLDLRFLDIMTPSTLALRLSNLSSLQLVFDNFIIITQAQNPKLFNINCICQTFVLYECLSRTSCSYLCCLSNRVSEPFIYIYGKDLRSHPGQRPEGHHLKQSLRLNSTYDISLLSLE